LKGKKKRGDMHYNSNSPKFFEGEVDWLIFAGILGLGRGFFGKI